MKHILRLFTGIFLLLTLTACLAEDYDVGVPTAYIQEVGLTQVELTKANISWSSSSGEEQQKIDNIQEFGLSQNKIFVTPNQKATLGFEENEKNGGDIWTDPEITATLWKNGEQINIELNELLEFQLPANEGNYVLEVNFMNPKNNAQYLGNIVIQKPSKDMTESDGQLPEYSSMEMPSIKKISSGSDNIVFDHSYEQVCWNNCDDIKSHNYSEIHSGNVEIGDQLLIDWSKMIPQPSEINLIHIDSKNNKEVIKTESIDITDTTLGIAIDEEKIGSQYAVEFLWKEGNELKGRTMLNFRLE